MNKSVSEVAVHHLKAVVQCPERAAEGVTDTLETSTGRCVGLEHDERFLLLLRDHRGVEHGLDDVDTRIMGEILRELRLRVDGVVAGSRIDGGTVVGRITGVER